MAGITHFEADKEYFGRILGIVEPDEPVINFAPVHIHRMVLQIYEKNGNQLIPKAHGTGLVVFPTHEKVRDRPKVPFEDELGRRCTQKGEWYRLRFGARMPSGRRQMTILDPYKPQTWPEIKGSGPKDLKISKLCRELSISPTKARAVFDSIEKKMPQATGRIGKRGDRVARFPAFAHGLGKYYPELARTLPAHLKLY